MFSRRANVSNAGLIASMFSGLFSRLAGAQSTAPQVAPRKPMMAAVHVNGFQKAPWPVGNNTRLPAERQQELIQAAREKREYRNARRATEHFWVCDNNPVCRAY